MTRISSVNSYKVSRRQLNLYEDKRNTSVKTGYQQIKWKEEINNHKVTCSLDIAISPSKSNVIFLTIPGVDGSVDS